MNAFSRLFGALLLIPAVALADDPMDEVVITATALHKSSLEVAQPTSVLTGDALIRDRGTSVGEALANTPGISATWFGPQASRPIIRGQSGERVQVSEDGAESLDVAALSADHAVTIDPLLAERVEVLRGPATLLYGNGTAGGLVNVLVQRVPEQAYPDVEGAAEVRGNSALGERALAARVDGGLPRGCLRTRHRRRRDRGLRVVARRARLRRIHAGGNRRQPRAHREFGQ
jgi:iron complex outermembrane receptor protein